MKILSISRLPAYSFYAAGIAGAVLGVAALLFWHSAAKPFYSIQAVPYGTAAGLVLYGLAVVALAFRWHALASVFAAALIGIAGIRLIEFLANANLEFESFFGHYDGYPQRTVLTALSFVLLGSALITLARKSRGKPSLIAASLIATAVLALSLATLAGSMSAHYTALDSLRFDGVKVPVALLFLALSASLIGFVFFARREHGISIARWAPLAVGLGVFVGALQLWQALVVWEEREIEKDVVWAASAINSHLRSRLKEQVSNLERLASRWEVYEPTESQWRADVRATLRHSHFTGIAWFDKNLRLRWSSQPGASLIRPARGKDPSFSQFLVLDSGEMGVHVMLPLFYQNTFDGVIAGALPMRELLREILLGSQPGFSLALIEGEREVISLNGENAALARRLGVEQPFVSHNTEWTLRIAPAEEYLEVARTGLPQALLVSGFVAAILLAAAVFFYQSARARATESGIAHRQLARETEGRQHASLALAQSEERLSEIMKQAQDAIVSFDSGQNITRFNRAAEKIFAVPAEEMLGQPIGRLLPGAELFASHKPGEMTAARSDGAAFIAEVSISRSGSDEEAVYTAVLRDISERKRIEHETKDAMEYYLRLFADFPTLVRRTDVSGQCDYVNDAWRKHTGRAREEELGEGWSKCVHPEDADMRLQAFARAFNSRGPFEMEYRLRGHDGQYAWIHDFGKPTHDLNGVFKGYLHACYDISARKGAQLQLERSRKQLRALSAHLQTVREEEKLVLARRLHDELGSKLTALKLDLGWLTAKLPPEAREKAVGMGKALDAALNSMRRMWSELRPSVLDDLGLSATIKWEAREFRKLWRIPVHVRLEPEEADVPPPIALALYRILQEALANIAVHAKATEVAIHFRANDDAWALEVRDDGVGVDEAKIAAADSGGYGLSAMLERARALNGMVTVKRAAGRGTAVTATLPRPMPKRAA